MTQLNLAHIQPLQEELNNHPVYGELRDLADLRVFMAHHVFPVWDFMSLVKYLQRHIAPVQVPWLPEGDPALRHFINRLVQEEESDEAPPVDGRPAFASHFELYLGAMRELGADATAPLRFIEAVRGVGIEKALELDLVPEPARRFTSTTFCFINEDRPHLVAAALAVGRERVIPGMFRRFLAEMGVGPAQAPVFHFYLERHVHLDEDFHGPLSLQLLEGLCGGDRNRLDEAEAAAEEAICARIRFWDGVREAILAARG